MLMAPNVLLPTLRGDHRLKLPLFHQMNVGCGG
jgi:hypothetical protein